MALSYPHVRPTPLLLSASSHPGLPICLILCMDGGYFSCSDFKVGAQRGLFSSTCGARPSIEKYLYVVWVGGTTPRQPCVGDSYF